MPNIRKPLWMVRLLYYEYWPWWFFYLPLLPYYLWYAFSARSLLFFAKVNPGMTLGGLKGDEKMKILQQIPAEFLPATALVESGSTADEISLLLQEKGMSFPLIAKPNVGERGKQVALIHHMVELQNHLMTHPQDFILQEYITYPLEVGVFYHRLPGSNRGRITSITLKRFLSVTGDGKTSVGNLLEKSDRGRLQLQRLHNHAAELIARIPLAGEQVLVEPIGNHCRGTEFIDGNSWLNEDMNTLFDRISLSVTGFHYGRFDLKVASLNDLCTGQHLKIMELNGIASEPAHIYDVRHNLWKAYRDVLHHWQIIWQIYQHSTRLN